MAQALRETESTGSLGRENLTESGEAAGVCHTNEGYRIRKNMKLYRPTWRKNCVDAGHAQLELGKYHGQKK